MKKNKRIYILIIIALIYFLLYVYFTYKKLNFEHTFNTFMVLTQKLLGYLKNQVVNIVSIIMTKDIFKIIVIIFGGGYILDKRFNICGFINKIDSIDIADKVSIKVLNDIKDNIKHSEENEEGFTNKNEEDATTEVDNVNNEKIEIIDLLIQKSFIVKIISRFINKKIKRMLIKMTVLNANGVKIEDISKLFQYNMKGDAIEIIGLNKDKENIIYEVYGELVQNGAVFVY